MSSSIFKTFFKQKRNKPNILILVFIIIPLLTMAVKEEQYKIRTLVIDAGHGGKDSGAKGKTIDEKDIALNITLLVGSYINKHLPDVKVIYTRKKDVFIPLYERAQIANNNHADVFMSIHINSNPSNKPYGTETYVMGLHTSEKNLDVAKKENSVVLQEENYVEQYDGFNPNSPEAHIIFSLYQNIYLEQSLNLASKIQGQFSNRAKRKNRGVKQAGFLVLWKTTMPSVLIEAGFISNLKEEKYLASKKGQEYLASAIFRAFRNYKEDVESRSRNTTSQKASKNSGTKTTSKESHIEKTDSVKEYSNNIYFRIQLTASSTKIPIDNQIFNGLEEIVETSFNSIYKYTCGKFKKYKDAVRYISKAKEKFPDAFIIAIQGGKQVSITKEIIKNSNI